MNPGKRYLFLLFGVIGFFVQPAYTQAKLISGQVRDIHSDEPIPFASVSFLHTTSGTLTDTSGLFSLQISQWPGDTLAITCVGYQRILLLIDKTKDSIRLNLQMERGTFN